MVRDILAEIVEKKRGIVAAAQKEMPLAEVKRELQPASFRMAQAFKEKPWNLIAECKLQSPAKGRLCRRYTVEELAHIYEDNGAAMLSVHTDPHFLGCNEDFCKVRSEVKLPLLRKDFIIDPYQIYEARMLGADAVLLIARILTPEQLKSFLYTTWSLGMDALVEIHDEEDMAKALATPARFIGINNRNLKYFQTTIQNTLDLLPVADRSRILISESGIHTLEEAKMLREAGLQGILVGEGLSTAPDVEAMTRAMAQL